MKNDKTTVLSIIWILLGSILFALGISGVLDSVWSGMGGGLIGIGLAQMIRRIRYCSDPAYKEKIDIQTSDERNRFIADRAWSFAGRLYVCTAAIAIVVLSVGEHTQKVLAISASVGVLMVLYWGCYFYMRKKY